MSKPGAKSAKPQHQSADLQSDRSLEIFCACAPGLEPILANEIAALGLEGTAQPGGVSLRGTHRDLLRLNLWLRTAGRVLLRLGTFPATSFPELLKRAGALPFASVLEQGRPLALKATCRKSRLYHSGAVIERVHQAVEARLGAKIALVSAASDEDKDDEVAASEPPADEPRQLILIRFDNDQCTISADASGALLHRRGYRKQLSQAPLRETLAAALLLAAGYRGGPLLDPCCGGGTIPIEAALIAAHRAPGLKRGFACERWRGISKALGEEVRREASASEKPLELGMIAGADLDRDAIAAAQTNARAAGFAQVISFHAKALESWRGAELRAGTLLIANPPYGKRVGEPGAELVSLWRALGELARAHTGPAALLCPMNALSRAAGPSFRPLLRTRNGGLPVQMLAASAEANAR